MIAAPKGVQNSAYMLGPTFITYKAAFADMRLNQATQKRTLFLAKNVLYFFTAMN